MQALEFINYVCDMMGWGQTTNIATDTDPDVRKAIRVSQATLKAMQNDKEWPELRENGVVDIPAQSALAGFTTSYGSATVVYTGTLTADYVGTVVDFGDANEYLYRVVSVGVNTLDVDHVVQSASELNATGTFTWDFASLPSDFDRNPTAEMFNMRLGAEVTETDNVTMRKTKRDAGTSLTLQTPQTYVIHGRDASGDKLVHFDYATGVVDSYSFEYQKRHPDLTANATEILYPERHMLYVFDSIMAKLRRDVEDSEKAQIAAQDALKEAIRVGSNPDQSRSRTRMRVDRLKHGSYRRY